MTFLHFLVIVNILPFVISSKSDHIITFQHKTDKQFDFAIRHKYITGSEAKYMVFYENDPFLFLS